MIQAQVIINDSFGSYASDAALLQSWSRVSGTATTILLATDPAAGDHGQGVSQTTAAGRLRQTVSPISPSDSNPLTLRFDFYDVNGGTTSGRVYGEIRNSASSAGLLAAGLFNSVTTGVYSQAKYQARNLDAGNWIQLDAPRSVGWHTFEFTVRALILA